jgi:hypothetical protein
MSTRNRRGENREALREELWPGSAEKVWKSAKEKGYFPSPRNLPLVLQLMREKGVCGTLDPSSVYLEFLHRDMGEGIVEVLDEDEHAFCAGYVGGRAVRTWRERVAALQRAGFIKVFPKGNRNIGYVVIVHPCSVVANLRRDGKVGDRWWQLFQELQRKVGAPPAQDLAAQKRLKVVPVSRPKSRAI